MSALGPSTSAAGGGMPVALRSAVAMFFAFALAYFFSALLRAVTATLAPHFSAELGLTAADLGLLAGTYFLGFALAQLPLGSALDRHGPRRVVLLLMTLAVAGCAGFAIARDLAGLTIARALTGVGVSACLMAPMTAFRRTFTPDTQLRANAWMLMTGSLGMVASTLPVQWLLPAIGWRGLFWLLAGCVALSMLAIAVGVPRDDPPPVRAATTVAGAGGYRRVLAHPVFLRFMPLAVFHHGGMIAMQALWIGPWLVNVCGWSPMEAARGLFAVNVAMLLAFLGWGAAVPRLYRRGWTAARLIGLGAPASLLVLGYVVWRGPGAAAVPWLLFCVLSTVVTLAQPAVGQSFEPALAGRALSAFNLLIFLGVFAVQWGIGLGVDLLRAGGWDTVSAHRGAIALWAVCALASYVWFLLRPEAAAPPQASAA